eukprot:TRINITY_DN68446_c0_g1_i1.p1 TRINITY_DN68446_c0_g1~~TRINITY_DN68446_c0_g1_i1.p1  ORF type:complete len:322 (-),score=18.59 TRINITY_DN68446_c0_g1_i1:45-1010(-)
MISKTYRASHLPPDVIGLTDNFLSFSEHLNLRLVCNNWWQWLGIRRVKWQTQKALTFPETTRQSLQWVDITYEHKGCDVLFHQVFPALWRLDLCFKSTAAVPASLTLQTCCPMLRQLQCEIEPEMVNNLHWMDELLRAIAGRNVNPIVPLNLTKLCMKVDCCFTDTLLTLSSSEFGLGFPTLEHFEFHYFPQYDFHWYSPIHVNLQVDGLPTTLSSITLKLKLGKLDIHGIFVGVTHLQLSVCFADWPAFTVAQHQPQVEQISQSVVRGFPSLKKFSFSVATPDTQKLEMLGVLQGLAAECYMHIPEVQMQCTTAYPQLFD